MKKQNKYLMNTYQMIYIRMPFLDKQELCKY